MKVVVSALAAICLATSAACVQHIRPYVEKHRIYKPAVEHPAENASRNLGSLFGEQGFGAVMMNDDVAQTVNDLVQVVVDEQSIAEGAASTELANSSSYQAALDELLGILQSIKDSHPDFMGAGKVALSGTADFKGSGKTVRNERLQATVPVMVRQVLPNGNLFIEGHKVLMVNQEENHIYISGVIRRSDIQQDNTVRSNLIAEAQFEVNGRGNVTDQTEKGWGASVLDTIWPF